MPLSAPKHYQFDITLKMIQDNDCSTISPVELFYANPSGTDEDDTATYRLVDEAATVYRFRPGGAVAERDRARDRLKWLKIRPEGEDRLIISIKPTAPKWSDGDFEFVLIEQRNGEPQERRYDPLIKSGGPRI